MAKGDHGYFKGVIRTARGDGAGDDQFRRKTVAWRYDPDYANHVTRLASFMAAP